MIKQGQTMFKVPPKLATDIRAHWIEKENHRVCIIYIIITCLFN